MSRSLIAEITIGNVHKILLSSSFLMLFVAPVFAGEVSMTGKIGHYDFSLREIENGCEVHRNGYSNGDIECIENLRPVEQKCNVSFHKEERSILDCRGNDFQIVAQQCSIKLFSRSFGSIKCH